MLLSFYGKVIDNNDGDNENNEPRRPVIMIIIATIIFETHFIRKFTKAALASLNSS